MINKKVFVPMVLLLVLCSCSNSHIQEQDLTYNNSAGLASVETVEGYLFDPEAVEFGKSVSVSGDTLVVGAPGTNNNTGAVYVYRWNANDSKWEQEYKYYGEVDGELFGRAVAIDGDTMAIGAKRKVIVFQRVAFSWEEDARFAPEADQGDTIEELDSFGASVDIAGSLLTTDNTSFFDVLAVGAPLKKYRTDSYSGVGEIYVYVRKPSLSGVWGVDKTSDGIIRPLPYLNPVVSEGEAKNVGTSVAINLSFANIVAGAPGEQDYYFGVSFKGAAYSFIYRDNLYYPVDSDYPQIWDQRGLASDRTKIVRFPKSSYQDVGSFGTSVAVNGYGMAVGAPANANSTNKQGFVYVFTTVPGDYWGWPYTSDGVKKLSVSGTRYFGTSVAISSEYNSDGVYGGGYLVVGAPGNDVDVKGSVFLYKKVSTGQSWTDIVADADTPKLEDVNGSIGDKYGYSVDIFNSSDVDRVVVIGSPGKNSGQGGVFVYKLQEKQEVDPCEKAAAFYAYIKYNSKCVNEADKPKYKELSDKAISEYNVPFNANYISYINEVNTVYNTLGIECTDYFKNIGFNLVGIPGDVCNAGCIMATPIAALRINRGFIKLINVDKDLGDVNLDCNLNPLDSLILNRIFIKIVNIVDCNKPISGTPCK